jgi:hypothetical protein
MLVVMNLVVAGATSVTSIYRSEMKYQFKLPSGGFKWVAFEHYGPSPLLFLFGDAVQIPRNGLEGACGHLVKECHRREAVSACEVLLSVVRAIIELLMTCSRLQFIDTIVKLTGPVNCVEWNPW